MENETLLTPIQDWPVLLPLVQRHAEDAAFYWSQLDSVGPASIDVARFAHFSRQLRCHLHGLHAAGDAGREVAWAALQRWKKPGEAFVCSWLALQNSECGALDTMLTFLEGREDQLLRGVISAFGHVTRSQAETGLAPLSVSSKPLHQVLALRASALHARQGDDVFGHPLRAYLKADDACVRASACRLASSDEITALTEALTDPVLAVRAEAAIALTALQPSAESARTLQACVLAQAEVQSQATGWGRKQAARRLERWVRKLAEVDCVDADLLLPTLPAQAALTLILHRGDMTQRDFVSSKLQDPAVAEYAAWVWRTLTGCDPEAAPGQLDSQGQVLLGRALDPGRARDLLATGHQQLRQIAAAYLTRTGTVHRVDIRAPFATQRRAMDALFQTAVA